MMEELDALRLALEHEQAIAGPFVPLGTERSPGQVAAREEHPSATASPSPDPRNENDDDMPQPTRHPSADLTTSSSSNLSPYERIEGLIAQENPVREIDSLDALRAYMEQHVLIPLDRERTKLVFGTGDPEANLMIIGEAPGADEDRQGEPFVGRAGKLLNDILKAIGFAREEVYIANILKSRPPNNREPQPEEVAAHLPVLYKQIALVEPKIILCVGRTAGNGMLGAKESLANLRTKEHSFHGLPLLVTYHPAALLRNEQWKRPTWEDVKRLRARYDELVAA